MDRPARDPGPVEAREHYWSARTVDWTFFAALLAATVALPILFVSFLDALLFALVVVVVSWPLYERICRATGGRKQLSAGLTTLFLAVAVFVPLALLATYGVSQAIALLGQAVDFVKGGGVEAAAADLLARWRPFLDEYLPGTLASDVEPLQVLVAPVQQEALVILQSASSTLPNLLAATARTGVSLVIFAFAVVTLYVEGPAVGRVVHRLSPMDDAYEDDLFEVFRQLASNMVLGSLSSAVVQGCVAGVGYAIAGVPMVVLWAVLTGVASFVPVVGTVVVWLPICVYVATTSGPGWAGFLALWSLVLTGTLDNVVKTLVLRGRTSIHPLLIFLGIFGGLSWMGLSGVLVGPVIVAFFLALYTIYTRDFLGHQSDGSPVDLTGEPGEAARRDAGANASERRDAPVQVLGSDRGTTLAGSDSRPAPGFPRAGRIAEESMPMTTYKVPALNDKTSKADQNKLMAALKGVQGVETATLRLGAGEFEIKPLPNQVPKRELVSAASSKAGFPTVHTSSSAPKK